MNTVMFPILTQARGGIGINTVPWMFVATASARIERNHGGQSLMKLASRGGLAWGELLCGLQDAPLSMPPNWTEIDQARAVLMRLTQWLATVDMETLSRWRP